MQSGKIKMAIATILDFAKKMSVLKIDQSASKLVRMVGAEQIYDLHKFNLIQI